MREKLARLLAFGTGLVIVLFSVLFAFIQNPINIHLPPGTQSLPSTSTAPVITYLDPESIKAGRMVYREHTCARCHSIAGKGNPRNPLDNVGLKLASTTMRGWITGEDSLQGLLPERAFKQKQPYKDLSEDELTALVIYMQSLRPEHMQTTPTEPVAEPDSALSGENGSCLSCHSNAGHLMQVVIPPAAPPEDGCATAPSRPAFLNAFVNPQFIETVHGEIGCTGCHGGDASMEEKEGAHKGMKAAETSCVSCHEQISELHATSLHGSLNGMVHALKMRSGEDNYHKLNIPWEKDCASCHGGCSACHVTLPKAVGGGLIKGHEFFKRPPMKDSCAVCHGSRAGGEYLGQWDGYKPDVHYDAGMHCLDCHTNDLHGDGKTYTNRWEVAGRPQCTDCHDALPNDNAKAHDSKHKNISCQVCHGQPYQNCFDCHSSMEGGKYVRRASHKGLDFKIGLNTAPGYSYDIVPLRNNPVARDSFDYFGEGLLPHFDKYPTWKTAAPHNIRRVTPQNKRCENCHGNPQLFLHESELSPIGSKANHNVIMTPAKELQDNDLENEAQLLTHPGNIQSDNGESK